MKAPLLALVLLATGAPAQLNAPAWTRPITPFPVIGPIDHVGAQGLAAYRIHTRRGATLLDGTLAENVPGSNGTSPRRASRSLPSSSC